ncbi:MAG TPA: hypothetical protein ENH91_07230 [Leeuwenhoekiella sp.]|nr:hypothetical protein [Leeuwenhoekiella sp.]
MKKLFYLTLFAFIFAPALTALQAQTLLQTVSSEIRNAQASGETINSANKSVQSTISNSKETINDIGSTITSLFGKKKNKDGSSANQVDIVVPNVTYGDAALNALVEGLEEQRRVKEISKTFSDGVMTISLDTKENPNEIWEKIDKKLREPFSLMQMDDGAILLNKKGQEPENKEVQGQVESALVDQN